MALVKQILLNHIKDDIIEVSKGTNKGKWKLLLKESKTIHKGANRENKVHKVLQNSVVKVRKSYRINNLMNLISCV